LILAFLDVAYAQDTAKWQPHVEGLGFYGDEFSFGGTEVFAPLWQNENSLLFVNAQYRNSAVDNGEISVGLGLRRMLTNWNFGGYTYVDTRKTAFDNRFTQISGGLEALGPILEFRANGYVSVDTDAKEAFSTQDTAVSVSSTTSSALLPSRAELIGGTVLVVSETETTTVTTTSETTTTQTFFEKPLNGFDGEVGVRAPFFSTESKLQLYAFAGGFYFDADDVAAIAGPSARLEARAFDIFGLEGSRLTIEARFRDDEVRGTDAFIGGRFRLPIGKSPRRRLTYQQRRMIDPVVRDVDVVLQQNQITSVSQSIETSSMTTTNRSSEAARNALTGVVIENVVTVDATRDFRAEIAGAGDNSLVIVDGSQGDFIVPVTETRGIEIGDGATLLGAGSTISLQGNETGRIVTLSPGGIRPTITEENVRTRLLNITGSDVHVEGINFVKIGGGDPISRTPNISIRGDSLQNIFLIDNVINNGITGISLPGNSFSGPSRITNIVLEGNRFEMPNFLSVAISGGKIGDITITNNVFEAFDFGTGGLATSLRSRGVLVRLRASVVNGAKVNVSGNTLEGECSNTEFIGSGTRSLCDFF